MSPRQLMYFMEVYKLKSITKAAEVLMISTQGLSKTIINLEKELNLKLFNRDGNILMPTINATTLLPYAQRIIDSYNQIENLANGKYRLKICTIDNAFNYFDVHFLSGYYAENPNVLIDITETSNEIAISQLRANDCELAIVQFPNEYPSIKKDLLFRSRFCMVIHKENPLSKLKIFRDPDWDGQKIGGRGSGAILFESYLQKLYHQGYHPVMKFQSNNDKLVISMAEDNQLIACVSELALKSYHSEVTTVVPLERKADDINYLAYNSMHPLSPQAMNFRQYILDNTNN